MESRNPDEIRKVVSRRYADIATQRSQGCCSTADTSCCGPSLQSLESLTTVMGYSEEQIASVPEGANMGLGCGNPSAIASLKPGETVLDLGSGGGFDCFLAAQQVGETGRVIGVDMTPEMVHKARENAGKAGYRNVEFRLGEIEHLPVADNSVDVIMSNCVINLSPDKQSVYAEAFRVLKAGGRLAIADIVTTAPLPEDMKNDMALLAGCVAGAATIEENQRMLERAGFREISIRPKDESRKLIRRWVPGRRIEDYIVSATIEAVKPAD